MRKVRLLIADDSATLRAALKAVMAEYGRIEVVGEAADGAEAVARANALRPDVITMDIQMPRLSGLEATAEIMATAPARILIVAAVGEGREVDLSIRAIAYGALELIAKPSAGSGADFRTFGKKVCDAALLMAEVPVVTRRRLMIPARPAVSSSARMDLVGLVASTGGPPALATILSGLPPEFPVPILIAQHIASGFVQGLARWFAEVTPLKVFVAANALMPLPGHVYLPPDGCDLTVDAEGLLRVEPSRGLHCPSGTNLLASLAKTFGGRACGVVLTGMGDDGAHGLLAIREAGGVTFAQDEATSVVYGMPNVAVKLGAASQQLSLETIAPTLRDLCRMK